MSANQLNSAISADGTEENDKKLVKMVISGNKYERRSEVEYFW